MFPSVPFGRWYFSVSSRCRLIMNELFWNIAQFFSPQLMVWSCRVWRKNTGRNSGNISFWNSLLNKAWQHVTWYFIIGSDFLGFTSLYSLLFSEIMHISRRRGGRWSIVLPESPSLFLFQLGCLFSADRFSHSIGWWHKQEKKARCPKEEGERFSRAKKKRQNQAREHSEQTGRGSSSTSS